MLLLIAAMMATFWLVALAFALRPAYAKLRISKKK